MFLIVKQMHRKQYGDICSHVTVSRLEQIRQQFANTMEKKRFFIYHISYKYIENLITLCQRIEWYFARTDQIAALGCTYVLHTNQTTISGPRSP